MKICLLLSQKVSVVGLELMDGVQNADTLRNHVEYL